MWTATLSKQAAQGQKRGRDGGMVQSPAQWLRAPVFGVLVVTKLPQVLHEWPTIASFSPVSQSLLSSKGTRMNQGPAWTSPDSVKPHFLYENKTRAHRSWRSKKSKYICFCLGYSNPEDKTPLPSASSWVRKKGKKTTAPWYLITFSMDKGGEVSYMC